MSNGARGGGGSLGTRPQKTEIEEKLYDIIYTRHDKGKGKYSKHYVMGIPIGQDVKKIDKNNKKGIDDEKSKDSREKKGK